MKKILTYDDFLNESTFKKRQKKLNKLNSKLKKTDFNDKNYANIKKEISNLETDISNNHKVGNSYAVGDIVLIRYWETGDLTPVKITKILSKNSYYITHNIEGSLFRNAPDTTVKSTNIIGMYRSNATPAIHTDMNTRQTDKISNDLVINGYPKGI